ncbi:DUF4142 domain-containing protein [Rhodopseudomonas palustris]|uniref:DUF4142 domain-containing protein n=1 Tax=Rhodopseudomonas palustris TaxID=1076 RepID=UPI000642281E|nr:DUF4142 domain-containing protein [Rhodopseudomonas palustris]
MKGAAILLSCILLATPAAAQTAAQAPGAPPVAISSTTAGFIQQVAVSDLYETAAARLALARGTDAQKQFADKMLQDHGKTSADVRRMIANHGLKVDVPSQPDARHQAMLDELNDKRGDAFVAAYAAQQVQAHQEAVELFQSYASNGDFPQLKQWAAQTLPVLEHHLKMAQQLGGDNAATVGASPATK